MLTSEEFVKGIQEGRVNKTTRFRIRASSSPPTQLGETLLYVLARRKGMKGPTKPTSGSGKICRSTHFESLENEAVRIARLLPKKTNKLSECVVLVTRVNYEDIYSTTNFVIPGYYYSTKIQLTRDTDLSEILYNSVSDQKPSDARTNRLRSPISGTFNTWSTGMPSTRT